MKGYLLTCVALLLLHSYYRLGGCASLTGAVHNMATSHSQVEPINVLGGPLQSCCLVPLTGFYRDGFCKTGAQDHGTHVICAEVTEEFLEYTKGKGNDLSTPAPAFRFPGLKPGDKWCLCASRWREAMLAGKAPRVHLARTHAKALEYVSLEDLKRYAVDLAE